MNDLKRPTTASTTTDDQSTPPVKRRTPAGRRTGTPSVQNSAQRIDQQLRDSIMNPVQLDPDLMPYLHVDPDHGPVLHHPLVVQSHLHPCGYGLVNHSYRRKREVLQTALQAHDWGNYIWLHERPYRLDALHECIGKGLCGKEYWEMVGDVWTACENIHQNLSLWRTTWQSREPGREHAMTDEEYKAHGCLGDETTVWRGTAHRRSIQGLSWTTDKAKAEWFARRFPAYGAPLLATGTVKREDVLATILRRDEHEVVCQKVTVTEVQGL